MADEPIIYYRPGCPFALRLRTTLWLHRIPFTSVKFRDDETGAEQVRSVNDGEEISPTVHVAGQWLTNPHWQAVVRAASA